MKKNNVSRVSVILLFSLFCLKPHPANGMGDAAISPGPFISGYTEARPDEMRTAASQAEDDGMWGFFPGENAFSLRGFPEIRKFDWDEITSFMLALEAVMTSV
ncbi:MAG: hypothetical protein ABH883_01475 [Candidatus Omnitrophota bacterium]